MFRLFSKKHAEYLADRVSSGGFSVFLPFSNQTKENITTKKTNKVRYHIVIWIFLLTIFTHTWTFFERHFLKNAIAPIAFVVTGFFYDQVFGAPDTTEKEKPKENAPPQNPPAEKPSEKAVEKKEAPTDAKTDPKADPKGDTKSEVKPEKVGNETFDPLSLDEGRIKILLSLHDREKEIKLREEQLATRESMAKALEVQVQKKSTELSELKGVIESLSKNYNEQVNKNIKNLVSIYEGMKPKDAAKFFDELPMEVLISLVKEMSPKKTSAIFALMHVDKVKSITDRLALMPQVPEKK